MSLARAVLVAVESTADLLAQTTGMARETYRAPLGYRPRFTGMPALPAPAPGEPLQFAFWGGVGRHKGVDVLLRAFRAVHEDRGGRAELHVLGGESDAFGDERPRWRTGSR